MCACKSVYLYNSLYSLKVYRFTCAHFNWDKRQKIFRCCSCLACYVKSDKTNFFFQHMYCRVSQFFGFFRLFRFWIMCQNEDFDLLINILKFQIIFNFYKLLAKGFKFCNFLVYVVFSLSSNGWLKVSELWLVIYLNNCGRVYVCL